VWLAEIALSASFTFTKSKNVKVKIEPCDQIIYNVFVIADRGGKLGAKLNLYSQATSQ